MDFSPDFRLRSQGGRTVTRQDILASLAGASARSDRFWGVAVSRPGDVAGAAAAGAAWVVVSHAGVVDPNVPASVMGLLPYANANAETLRRAALIGEAAIPALAGVYAADQFNTVDHLLTEVRAAGYRAVQNFPSVGLAEGRFRAFHQEASMGYEREVELLKKAADLGMFVSAVVFSADHAKAMSAAGADMLVFHPGLDADGEYRTLSPSTRRRFAEIAEIAAKRRGGIMLARLAFDGEVDDWRLSGVQYDRNFVVDGNSRGESPCA